MSDKKIDVSSKIPNICIVGGGQRTKDFDACRRPRNDFAWTKKFHRFKKRLDCYRLCKIN